MKRIIASILISFGLVHCSNELSKDIPVMPLLLVGTANSSNNQDCPVPTFYPGEGTYNRDLTIYIKNDVKLDRVVLSVDGTDPDPYGKSYAMPITIRVLELGRTR